MKSLTFSLQEMIQSLEKIGYTIKQDKEVVTFRTYHDQTEDKEVNIYNAYYLDDPKPMCTHAGHGTRRIEAAFEFELKNKLLKLF